MSTIRQPSADHVPGRGGTSTVGTPSSLASAAPCSGAGAAEHDERELARVVAALQRDDPHRVGHVRVGDGDDRLGRLVSSRPSGSATRVRIASSAASRSSDMPPPTSSLAEPAEDEVGVGVRRLLAALAVARRARDRRPPTAGRCAASRRRRSTPASRRRRRSSAPRSMGSRSGGRTRRTTRWSCAARRRRRARCRCSCRPCRRRSRSRSPHSAGDVAAGDRARRDARGGEPHGELLDGLGRHHAAAGVQDQQVAVVAVVLQPRARARST